MLEIQVLKEFAKGTIDVDTICLNIYGTTVLKFKDLLEFKEAIDNLVNKGLLRGPDQSISIDREFSVYIITNEGKTLADEPDDVIIKYLEED